MAVPEPDNPAFKYGKILVARPGHDRPDVLFVGLAFEKGLGPSAADAYPQDRRIDRTWAWVRTLTPALRSGALQEAANRAESAAGLPLTVVISTGPLVPGAPPDIARFSWGGGTLRSTEPDVPSGRLSALRGVSTLSALAPVLESAPDADWYWVDFNIGVVLVRGTAGTGATWSAGEIWRRACEPWVGWLG